MTVPTPSPIRRPTCCAAAALLLAGPALADVTAREVRDDFEAAYEAMGMTVEVGSETEADGVVTLTDVVMSFEFTDEGTTEEEAFPFPAEPTREVRVEAAFPEIAFEDTDEGARADLPPSGELTVTTTDADTGMTDTARLALTMEAASLLVSETAHSGADGADGAATTATGEGGDGGDGSTARAYALSADRLGVELVEASRGGEPVQGELLVALEDVAATTTVPVTEAGPDELRRYAQTGEIAAMSIRLDLPTRPEPASGEEEPPEPGRFVSIGETTDVVFSGEGAVPGGEAFTAFMEEDDPAGALRAGLAVALSLEYGPGTSEGVASSPADPAQSFSVTSASEGASAEMSFDADGMALSGRAGAVDYVVEGGGMPMERVEVALEGADFGLRTPLLEGETAPFELRYLIEGLTVNEEVWALFDPDGRLPRDPVTLLFDMGGQGRLLADIFDEETQGEDDLPMEFEEATLEFRLAAVGADVEADGAFTFDNDDLTTFPGFPAPTGTIDLVGSGIDALLDTLSEMGLVPPDQLMPARMMLGLFARSDGSGGYTSEIEVDGDTGSVTANGQRLR
jgi:hypothetical protein